MAGYQSGAYDPNAPQNRVLEAQKGRAETARTAEEQARAVSAGTAGRMGREANAPQQGPGSQSWMNQQDAQRSSIVDMLKRTLSGGASSSSSGSGYGNAPEQGAPQVGPYTPPGGPPARIGHMEGPDTSAANAAAFARAKDQVGQTSRGALTGLAGAMAGRGTVGSGVEGRGQQNIIQAGMGQLGDVSRQQAITNAELAQKTGEINYQGDISQRGQDIGYGSGVNANMLTARGQDITQRGQDLEQQRAMAAQRQSQSSQQASMLQGLLGALSGTNKPSY